MDAGFDKKSGDILIYFLEEEIAEGRRYLLAICQVYKDSNCDDINEHFDSEMNRYVISFPFDKINMAISMLILIKDIHRLEKNYKEVDILERVIVYIRTHLYSNNCH